MSNNTPQQDDDPQSPTKDTHQNSGDQSPTNDTPNPSNPSNPSPSPSLATVNKPKITKPSQGSGSCQMHIENPYYFPGQTLQGRIAMKVTRRIVGAEKFLVLLKSFERVETRPKSKSKSKPTQVLERTYIRRYLILMDGGFAERDSEEKGINVGQHSWRFNFQLTPPDVSGKQNNSVVLPPSFYHVVDHGQYESRLSVVHKVKADLVMTDEWEEVRNEILEVQEDPTLETRESDQLDPDTARQVESDEDETKGDDGEDSPSVPVKHPTSESSSSFSSSFAKRKFALQKTNSQDSDEGLEVTTSKLFILSDPSCDPSLSSPANISFEKGFLLQSGQVDVSIRLAKTVFCPGSSIPVHLTIQNDSSHSIKRLKVLLVRHVSFQFPDPDRDDERDADESTIVSVVKMSKLCSDHEEVAHDVSVPIPAQLTPSTDGELISCQYDLEFHFSFSLAVPVKKTVPVKIAIVNSKCPREHVLIYSKQDEDWKRFRVEVDDE